MISVNWEHAKAYIAWVSRKTGKSYRLLSEAKREYVTRAGMTTPFWRGSSITPKQANYVGSAEPYKGGGAKGEYRGAHGAGRQLRAELIWIIPGARQCREWTEDCRYDSNTGNPGDGRARTTGECGSRVIRGGSWYADPQVRAASRDGEDAGTQVSIQGFRVARTLSP